MAWPWDELGVASASDEGVIRRAYATALKSGRSPEDDPAAFARLRAAYDEALRRTREARPAFPDEEEKPKEDGPEEVDSERAIRPPPAPPATSPDETAWAGSRAFLDRFNAALEAGDGPDAAEALAAWMCGEPTYPLIVSEFVEDEVFTLLDEDEDAPPEALAALGEAFGAEFGDARFAVRHAEMDGSLPRRVAAARWWLGVARIAAAGGPGAAPGHPSRVARALLGPPGAVPARAGRDWRDHPLLRALLAEVARHSPDLRGRPDPATVARLTQALAGRDSGGSLPSLLLGTLRDLAIPLGVVAAFLGGGLAFDATTARRPAATEEDAMRGRAEQVLPDGVSLRATEGQALVYFTNLLSCRGAIARLRYGIDRKEPDRDFPLFAQPPGTPVCGPFPPDATISVALPAMPSLVSVQVTWSDGARSGIALFRSDPPAAEGLRPNFARASEEAIRGTTKN